MAGAIHQLSGEQYEVLFQLVYYGNTHGASPMEILAAVATGIVEDTLHNRDTATPTNPAVGWRQEEPAYGSVAERLDLAKSIPNFYRETRERRGQYSTAGTLAQAVQRSDYPHRYTEEEGLARQLISELGTNAGHPGSAFGPEVTSGTAGLAPAQTATPTVRDTPLDYSQKVRRTGKAASEHGNHIGGHANAIRNLTGRHARL